MTPLAVREEDFRPRPFHTQLPGAFLYPLKGYGIFFLLFGGLFFGSTWNLFAAGFFLIPLLMAVVYFYGFLCAYCFNIVTSSADGEKGFPGWPDFTALWEDILRPLFLTAGILFVSFVPVLIYLMLTTTDIDVSVYVYLPLILSFFYLPMAFLTVAIRDSIWAVNPVTVFRSIFQVPIPYLAAWFTMVLIPLTYPLIAGFSPIGPALARFWVFYLLLVALRIVGLIYYTNSKTLAFF